MSTLKTTLKADLIKFCEDFCEYKIELFLWLKLNINYELVRLTKLGI